MNDGGVRLQLRVLGKSREVVVSEARVSQVRHLARRVVREPFTRRTWSELLFFVLSSPLAWAGMAAIAVTMFAGAFLAITFVGVLIIALSLRIARGFGGFHRSLAQTILGEAIEEPEPFTHRPGMFGWLQAALRDRAAWRAVAYSVAKIPLTSLGVWVSFSMWVDAFFFLTYPIFGRGSYAPPQFGVTRNLFGTGYFDVGTTFFHGLFIVLTGILLVFIAPWTMRAIVSIDRIMMRALLAPDALTARVRSLEHARAQTVDASAATLRRIERDLHDGTQAQLVALAMRLGQAREELNESDTPDLGRIRQLVSDAHTGAKEAIVELRDLARGIHPPALDIGLEGALSTLAARCTVPTELTVSLNDRPTPAIEAIAYFCVAELLANVSQHATASRASISCAQFRAWIRVVVRDDGEGGAHLSLVGSSSSGLAGLTDRVRAVDGHLGITSPAGGPTVITVDLPLHA